MSPIGPDWLLLAELRPGSDPAKPSAPLVVPLRLVTESNAKEHWTSRSARAKKQRHAVAWAWTLARWPRKQKPAAVKLTRRAARRLDPDNLVSSMKHVIDEIADLCGFNDRDPHVRWGFAQETSRVYELVVEIDWGDAP